MDQLNMSNRFKQFLPQQRPMHQPNASVSAPPQMSNQRQIAPPQQPQQGQHPMGQMLAQGNPANKENAIPVLQPPAQSVMPQGQMPQMPQPGMQATPQLPQMQEGQAANPHQAFIQTALAQGLPQEMIMQFLSSKLNLR